MLKPLGSLWIPEEFVTALASYIAQRIALDKLLLEQVALQERFAEAQKSQYRERIEETLLPDLERLQRRAAYLTKDFTSPSPVFHHALNHFMKMMPEAIFRDCTTFLERLARLYQECLRALADNGN